MSSWDSVADSYDDVAESALGRVLRTRVHEHIAPLVSHGTVVLDLGCGTGIDAAWMSARGALVTAVDGSEQMVRLAQKKLGDSGTAIVHDLDRDDLVDRMARPADLVLANFGVVNCVRDLKRLAEQVASVLGPGGVAVMVTMATYCPTEIAASVARLDVAGARRRMGGGVIPAEAPLGVGVHYYSARRLAAALGPALMLRDSWSIGTVLPTFEQRGYLEERPRLLRVLDAVDRVVARPSARVGLGDHQLAMFEVTP